jgi:hypothetical protein
MKTPKISDVWDKMGLGKTKYPNRASGRFERDNPSALPKPALSLLKWRIHLHVEQIFPGNVP